MTKYLRKHVGFIVVIVLFVSLLVIGVFSNMVHRESTGSMEPTLPVNSILVDVPAHDLKVGDIITFPEAGQDAPVTHRLIKINKDGTLVTKGDANPSPDNPDMPLTKSDVMGKFLFQVPVFVPSFWVTPRGIGFGLIVIALLAFYLTSGKEEDRSGANEGEDGDEQSDKSREATLESHPV